MGFEDQKKTALSQIEIFDRSKKGSLDENIRGLVEKINAHPDFYTTSSCGGRIIVYEKDEGSKKHETRWLYCTHGDLDRKKLRESINDCTADVWFAVEAVIIHLVARTKEQAAQVIASAQQSGLKRGGAISFSKRFVLELVGVDEFSTIIIKNGKKVVDDQYLELLMDEAESKLKKNAQRIALLSKFFD